MRRLIVLTIVGLACAAAAGGALVVVSGVIPIKSDGHWPATAWFLDFTKRRSVATHSIGVDVPALDAPWIVVKGAAHFEYGCRPCHGSPLGPPPAITERMTPHPPALAPLVDRWDPEELFYLVKHGIKFTGMPAWTSSTRDDEVWAVVAFLRNLPRTDAGAYARLAHGTTWSPPQATALASGHAPATTVSHIVDGQCAQCHGADGRGRQEPAFPRLAGQKADYLTNALRAYARGQRHSGTMGPVAAGLSDDMIDEVAAHYTALTGAGRDVGPQPDSERGATIALRGIPAREIPPCVECHPVAGSRHPAYPRLAGQFAEYLTLQLQLFKENRRGGSAFAHLMQPIASRLTADEMRAVAAFFASPPIPASVPEETP